MPKSEQTTIRTTGSSFRVKRNGSADGMGPILITMILLALGVLGAVVMITSLSGQRDEQQDQSVHGQPVMRSATSAQGDTAAPDPNGVNGPSQKHLTTTP